MKTHIFSAEKSVPYFHEKIRQTSKSTLKQYPPIGFRSVSRKSSTVLLSKINTFVHASGFDQTDSNLITLIAKRYISLINNRL